MLYISTCYRVLSIVYLDQLKDAHHTHISYHNKSLSSDVPSWRCKLLYIWEVMTLQTVSSLTVLATDVASSLSLTINGVPAMFNVPTTNHRVTVASYATTTDIPSGSAHLSSQ